MAIFAMATSLRMYAACQHLQAQARAHAAAASGLLGHNELRLHVPPSIAIATRGRLHGLRLQLALLDREFDELGICTFGYLSFGSFFKDENASQVRRLWKADEGCAGLFLYNFLSLFIIFFPFHFEVDYDSLRALDSDTASSTPSMTEEEINSLPVHTYKVAVPTKWVVLVSKQFFLWMNEKKCSLYICRFFVSMFFHCISRREVGGSAHHYILFFLDRTKLWIVGSDGWFLVENHRIYILCLEEIGMVVWSFWIWLKLMP